MPRKIKHILNCINVEEKVSSFCWKVTHLFPGDKFIKALSTTRHLAREQHRDTEDEARGAKERNPESASD
jgi:hypothetical protein